MKKPREGTYVKLNDDVGKIICSAPKLTGTGFTLLGDEKYSDIVMVCWENGVVQGYNWRTLKPVAVKI